MQTITMLDTAISMQNIYQTTYCGFKIAYFENRKTLETIKGI